MNDTVERYPLKVLGIIIGEHADLECGDVGEIWFTSVYLNPVGKEIFFDFKDGNTLSINIAYGLFTQSDPDQAEEYMAEINWPTYHKYRNMYDRYGEPLPKNEVNHKDEINPDDV